MRQWIYETNRVLVVLTMVAVATASLAAQVKATAPATTPATADANAIASPRPLVFAHYMVCFTGSVEMCKEEIRLAERHGLDGFAMDFGAWGGLDANSGAFKPTGYVANAENMFKAAADLGTGFKLLMTPEYSVQPIGANVEDIVKRFYKHPNVMRHQGKMVLSSYGPGGEAFGPTIQKLKAEGYDLFFVPFTGTDRYAMSRSIESVYRVFAGQEQVDGLWLFETDDSPEGCIRDNANARRACLMFNKLFMAGVSPSYASANIRDMQGLAGYGAVWEGIVNDRPEWVEIVTWNDYNEDTYLMPYKWKRQWDKPVFNKDGSHLDATAYWAQWYKAGRAPAITQDKLYFCYRNRSRYLTRGWDEKAQKWVDLAMINGSFDQMHDDVQDRVYFTMFLTAPAELTVSLGKTNKTFQLAAGVSHNELAMEPGVPHFVLRREGKDVLDVVGRRSVIAEATQENSIDYGFHLLQRTWPGAAAAGKAIRYEAQAGTLHGEAEAVKVAGRTCVRNAEKDASGFDLAVKDLSDAMYNVRVVYSNPSGRDVRLTLQADGAPRLEGGDKLSPYFIPVYLPPTGEGRFATASFFWPLYAKTTRLSLQWQVGTSGSAENPKELKPQWDDQGVALIDAVEMVRVEPTAAAPVDDSPLPQMVAIPGGKFAMGSKDGEPDEQPIHEVTVSPFAIGKYEVTNAQFERFMPKHRRDRDGFSWRDREPVIYVSWSEAARYCNWLSQQANLTPVYDDKTFAADLDADGYRLPTEAQWEYVASGRGQGRKYPWGAEAPQSGKHGLFAPADILEPNARVRSEQAQGAVVVGSYPAGASRDGVMDLAGNVAQWCSDWYQPYTDAAATNPCQQTASHSRVIRGGSWGYYSRSQRCADREFNSPKYPGYIFVGFRVALNEAGWKKVQGAGSTPK